MKSNLCLQVSANNFENPKNRGSYFLLCTQKKKVKECEHRHFKVFKHLTATINFDTHLGREGQEMTECVTVK